MANKLSDLSIDELQATLAATELSAGPLSVSALLIRRELDRKLNKAETAETNAKIHRLRDTIAKQQAKIKRLRAEVAMGPTLWQHRDKCAAYRPGPFGGLLTKQVESTVRLHDSPAAMKKLLTDSEAADLLQLTPRQVLRLANRGELPRVVFPNKEIRYEVGDLAQFVELHKRPAAPGGKP